MVPTLVGGLITWAVAKWYYARAAADLLDESVELRRKVDLVLLGLSNAGILHLKRNLAGEIVGLSVLIEVPTASASASGIPPDIKTGRDEH